eukprot:s3431_g4.t1
MSVARGRIIGSATNHKNLLGDFVANAQFFQMSLAKADDIPIPDSDSASDELFACEDFETAAVDDRRTAWSPGTEVLASADIEYVESNWEEPEVIVLRKGHLGHVVGLHIDCTLLVLWDELETPKPARYDQVQAKKQGADAWGPHSVCGLWANVLGHLWICPDPSNPSQCFYEEAPQDGGFLHGILRPTSYFCSQGVETVWWLGDVFAETGEHGTDEGNPHAVLRDGESSLFFASQQRFLNSPELSPEEDRWRHGSYAKDSNGPIGQIRVRLSPVNGKSLEVQICIGSGSDWDEIRDFDRQLPKIGCPLQILRFDGDASDCFDAITTSGVMKPEVTASFSRERGFSLQKTLEIHSKGEIWYTATVAGVAMPKLTLEASEWKIQDCAPPSVELALDGLHMNSRYDLHVALMSRSVLEYRGVSVEVITSGQISTFPALPTLSSVWYFVSNDGVAEPYREQDQITLESEWRNMHCSESPEFLGTAQLTQQYTVDLRKMKQISKRQTERQVMRRPVSLASDAPLVDVSLWQLVAEYGELVAARGKLPGIEASLLNLDNTETVAKLLFHGETKVLLRTEFMDGIADEMAKFDQSQSLLRESLHQSGQSDTKNDSQVTDRDNARKSLCSKLRQSAHKVADIEGFVNAATAAMKAFEDQSNGHLLTEAVPDLKSLPPIIRSQAGEKVLREADVNRSPDQSSPIRTDGESGQVPLFGPSTTLPLFGSGTSGAPSLFGSATSAAPSLFGSATSGAPSLFGRAPSLFGSATSGAPSLFGSATSGAPSLFGSATSGAPSLFGSATSGAPSLFGSATSGAPSLFGGTTSEGLSVFACASNDVKQAYRERLCKIYSQHNPGKVNEIASLMTKYAGREHTLYLKVCKKYKVQPKHEIKAAGGARFQASSNFDFSGFGVSSGGGLFGATSSGMSPFSSGSVAAGRMAQASAAMQGTSHAEDRASLLCKKLAACRAQLRNLRLEEVDGLSLSTATEKAKTSAVESLQMISRALEATSVSLPPESSPNATLHFAKAIAQEEGFQQKASARRQEFCDAVSDCCTSARALLRQMIGAAQADLGTLAEHLRLAEKHEELLSDPPDQQELLRLEDECINARDLHADNLEKERRLEREYRTEQRRGNDEATQAASSAVEDAQSAVAASRRVVQQAEQAFHRRLIDFVRIKQAAWGLPELSFNVDDEHLDAVDVLTPGRRCADYEQLVPVAGSQNTIFTAIYNDEPCVLKELRSMTQSGALRREVLHRKKLKHPLIVPVLAAFEEEDKGRSIAYVHMPRYSCNLEEWCTSEQCTLPKMRQVLRDLVLVVAYVHSQNVMHGDLKPSNFLMDSEERPCLTDFETSQCLDAQSLNSRRTTMVVGATQGFVPPEFPHLTAASDIYSLGCICDQLLSRKWPQHGEQNKAIAKLVKKMQSQRKEDRPTAVEVLERMTAAMKAETETSVPVYWRRGANGVGANLTIEVGWEETAEWQDGRSTFRQLQAALMETVHDQCLTEFFGKSSPRISFVKRVENPQLWRRYCLAKEQVHGAMFAPVSPPVRPSCPVIDWTRNEYWLWHGTRYSNIDSILKEGLDEHLSRLEGLYGAGIYFSDEACKALQYSDSGAHYLLFCRVVLGRPYYSKNTLPSMRSLKELKKRQGLLETPDVDGHHSVIVNPGPVQNHPSASGKQVHREFVVFDGAAVYPEYVVGINQ